MSDAGFPNIDVPFNGDWITERFYLCSRPRTQADIQTLLSMSVSHILNVCETEDPIEGTVFEQPGRYLWNETADDGQPKPLIWFQTSARFLMPLFAMSGPRVALNCFDGYDRSGVTMYYWLRAIGFTKAEAILLIKTHRPIALERYVSDADAALVHGW